MRRHHNNTGVRQIRRGKTRKQVEEMAKRLKIWKPKPKSPSENEVDGAKISGVNECDQAPADTSPVARPVRRSDRG